MLASKLLLLPFVLYSLFAAERDSKISTPQQTFDGLSSSAILQGLQEGVSGITVNALKASGYDLDKRDLSGKTLLMKAAQLGLKRIVLQLLAAGANKDPIAGEYEYVGGWTCLMPSPVAGLNASQIATKYNQAECANLIDQYEKLCVLFLLRTVGCTQDDTMTALSELPSEIITLIIKNLI